MLIRISLIIAILAALAAGVVNFVMVKKNLETVITQRNDEKTAKVKAEGERDKTRAELDKTTKDLNQTKEKLAATEQERDNAITMAQAATKKSEELTEKLTSTTTELNNTKAELAAYVATGFKPEQISKLGRQISDLQSALNEQQVVNKGLQRDLDKKIAVINKLTNPDYRVPLPADLQGKVLVADPKWEFVVIDVGEEERVLKDGELLVNRNGRLVAKLRVSEVQKGKSIANVMPGWKLADVMEGDQVIPAYMPE